MSTSFGPISWHQWCSWLVLKHFVSKNGNGKKTYINDDIYCSGLLSVSFSDISVPGHCSQSKILCKKRPVRRGDM